MATATEPTQSVKTKGRILIVDDELVVRDSLGKWFTSEGYTTKPVGGARDALETIQQQQFDIALIDIKMPGMDGMELQARLREADPDLTVVIMTGYASVETAVQALKHGAYDYITKPVDPDELSHLVMKAMEHRRARHEVARLRENLQEVQPGTELIGRSPAMKKVTELIEMVAPTEATVLITGESGTGKEVVARAIHAAGPRRYMPMVTIHCGALTETLLESELFGHEKGAFTGAQYRKKGKFEVADGGSVFLDEISDISLKTQTDLLRVLQEKEIVRVGGNQQIKVDFRCIAATNKNLETLVKAGSFRPDLYYRLHVFCIELPPLRDRREDIPLLVNHFLNKFCMATSRAGAADHAGSARPADAARLAGQRPRTGERGGARAGGGARHGSPARRFFVPVPGGRAARRKDPGRHRTGAHRADSAGDAAQPLAGRADPRHRSHDAVQQAAALRSAVKPIHLIPLADGGAGPAPGLDILEHLAATLAHTFRTPCRIRPETFDIAFAQDGRRGQYHSTAILQRMERTCDPDARVLGVTACDLYVPVLTFVFGEAQLDGNCAVVSTGAPAGAVLRHAAARRPAARAAGEGSRPRTGPHLRPAPLRGLALRDGVEPRRGAARRKGRGFLRRVPEAGLPERILVAKYYRRPRPSTFFIGENPVAPLNSSLAATALKIPFHLYRKGT